MQNIVLNNSILKVEIKHLGAELTSIYSIQNDFEYLWQADEKYWLRQAPILFPIVGKLENDEYYFKGEKYELEQHGFSKTSLFTVEEQTNTKVTLSFSYSEATLKQYPFKFLLEVTYELIDSQLIITYFVRNLEESEQMYFSIGAHPGFNVPLSPKKGFEDYQIEIISKKNQQNIPVTEDGLLSIRDMKQTRLTPIKLDYKLFNNGMMVYTTESSTKVALQEKETKKDLVTLSYDSFPFLGVWTAENKNAPFICIEPWDGTPDAVDGVRELEKKFAIKCLAPQKQYQNRLSIDFSTQ